MPGKTIRTAKSLQSEQDMIWHIGRNLRDLRMDAGLSMADVSHHLSVSYQQIQKYERGSNRLPIEKLYLLKRLYDIPYERFFEESKTPVPENSKSRKHPPVSARDDQYLDRMICADLAGIKDVPLKKKIYNIVRILMS